MARIGSARICFIFSRRYHKVRFITPICHKRKYPETSKTKTKKQTAKQKQNPRKKNFPEAFIFPSQLCDSFCGAQLICDSSLTSISSWPRSSSSPPEPPPGFDPGSTSAPLHSPFHLPLHLLPHLQLHLLPRLTSSFISLLTSCLPLSPWPQSYSSSPYWKNGLLAVSSHCRCQGCHLSS